jgi:hypothetical protein
MRTKKRGEKEGRKKGRKTKTKEKKKKKKRKKKKERGHACGNFRSPPKPLGEIPGSEIKPGRARERGALKSTFSSFVLSFLFFVALYPHLSTSHHVFFSIEMEPLAKDPSKMKPEEIEERFAILLGKKKPKKKKDQETNFNCFL